MYASIKGLALIRLGEFGQAWKSLQQEVAGPEDHFGRAIKDLGTATYLFELGAYARAAATFESVVEQARLLHRVWMERWALEGLAIALTQARHPDEERLRGAVQALSETSGGATGRVLSEASLRSGDPEAALQYAEAAREDAQAAGTGPDEVAALELQIRVLERTGEAASIFPLVDGAIGMAEEMNYRAMLWRLRAAKSRALELLGRRDGAEMERSAALALVWELAVTIPDAGLRNGFLAKAAGSSAMPGEVDG
jgi:tetratricopeptide (TPR) repeat protein